MMENDLPKRKKSCLEHYDYSSCGVYFLTICTSKRENYFWDNVVAANGLHYNVILLTNDEL